MIKAVAFVHPRYVGTVDDLQIFCEEIISAGLSNEHVQHVTFSYFTHQDPQRDLDVLIAIMTSEYASEDDRIARLELIKAGFVDLFREVNPHIRFDVEMPLSTPFTSGEPLTSMVDEFMAKAIERARLRRIQRMAGVDGLEAELTDLENVLLGRAGDVYNGNIEDG